jgi:hypothetical protein
VFVCQVVCVCMSRGPCLYVQGSVIVCPGVRVCMSRGLSLYIMEVIKIIRYRIRYEFLRYQRVKYAVIMSLRNAMNLNPRPMYM